MNQRKIDDIVMYSALLIYMAVWSLVPYWILGKGLWFIGPIWGVIYIVGHLLAIKKDGHCYMSADGRAMPLLFPFVSLTAIALGILGQVSGLKGWWNLFSAFGSAFFFGHVLAILYAAIMTGVLGLLSSKE